MDDIVKLMKNVSFSSLAGEWHPTKNIEAFPAEAKGNTNRKGWWVCFEGHEWEASIGNRLRGSKCLFCTNQKVLAGFNDLATTHPDLAEEWHPTLNEELTAQQVIAGSEKKVWWLGECGHEWEAALGSRSGKTKPGCPFCSNQKILLGFNDLTTTHPLIAAQWHPENNNGLKSDMVSANSNRKVWWLGECGHEWEAVVARRVNSLSGCPFCSNQKILLGFNDLATTHPEIAMQWHPTKNDSLLPTEVIAGTGAKIWWLCDKGHEWKASGAARKNNQNCPVCANVKLLTGFNDLETKYPSVAASWHPTKNGELLPKNVFPSAQANFWWVCDKGHEWEAAAQNRTNRNSACPHCANHVNKGEQEIYNFIASIMGEEEVQQSNRSLLKGKELDIYVPSKGFAVEFNGLYFHSEAFGKGRTYHYEKWLDSKAAGVHLMQIWEDDWSANPELIKRMIAYKLGVFSDSKIFARKTEVVSLSIDAAKKFFVENHLQGFRASTGHYGLTSDGVVVAALSVLRKGSIVEISRFAATGSVVGGFSKLLSHALKLPEFAGVSKVISYSHNDHASGGVYEASGFSLTHEGQPGYSYIVNNKRANRLSYTKAKFKASASLKFEEGLTERELADLNGLIRVWDAGSRLWTKEIAKTKMVTSTELRKSF